MPKTKNKKEKTIEICRSFSQKVSNPSNKFENMDFFASAKAEVGEKDKEKVSEELYAFVQDEVSKSVCAYKLENIVVKPTEPARITYENIKEAQKEAPEAQALQEKANEIPPEPEEANQKIDEALTPPEAELPMIET